MTPEIIAELESTPPGHVMVAAIEELLKVDGELLLVDANERSMTFRLAHHLQALVPDLHVDCEYNRDGIDPKRLPHFHLDLDAEDSEATTVYPDIIVHKRRTKENFLVVEVKKSSSEVSRDVDFAKLRGYRASLKYDYALYLELQVGEFPGISRAEWVDP